MIDKKQQVRKTIRFNLENLNDNLDLKSYLESDDKILISDFYSSFEEIVNDFKSLMFYNFNDEKNNIKNNFKINYKFLRDFTKRDFYEWKWKKNDEKNYKINDVLYLKDVLIRVVNSLEKNIDQSKYLINQPEESQSRNQDIAFLLKDLKQKDKIFFLKEFFVNLKVKNLKKEKDVEDNFFKLQNKLNEILSNLDILIKNYLPSQSWWLQLFKASFNYFTINKTEKSILMMK